VGTLDEGKGGSLMEQAYIDSLSNAALKNIGAARSSHRLSVTAV
jgi:hypothetical protein